MPNQKWKCEPTVKLVATRDVAAIVTRAWSEGIARKITQVTEDALAIAMCPIMRNRIESGKIGSAQWQNQNGTVVLDTTIAAYRIVIACMQQATFGRVREHSTLMQKYIAHEGNSHGESVRITMFATCYDPETVQRMEKELIPYQLRNVLNGNRTINSSARNTGQTMEEMAERLVNQ